MSAPVDLEVLGIRVPLGCMTVGFFVWMLVLTVAGVLWMLDGS